MTILQTSGTATEKRLPTFIIIGVQKAGTTSIYNYLKQHPQIYMSPIKETNFFERYWEQETPELQARRKSKNGIMTLDDYCRLFDGVTDEIAFGEVSPNYMFHHPVSVRRIRDTVPDIKLIAVLRNPVQRAYSDYLMHLRDAIGTPRPLGEQLKTSNDKSYVLLKGKYYESLKHFLDAFGPTRLQVFLYDDLCRNATAFMQAMYEYIGVDPNFEPDTALKMQSAKVIKNQKLNHLIRTQNPIRSAVSGFLRVLLPETLRRQLRSQIINLNSQDKSHLPLSDEERQLLQDYYREDILKLQDLIQRDLSFWLDSDEG